MGRTGSALEWHVSGAWWVLLNCLHGGDMLGTGYTDSDSPIGMEKPVDMGLDCAAQGRMVTPAKVSTEDGDCVNSRDGG